MRYNTFNLVEPGMCKGRLRIESKTYLTTVYVAAWRWRLATPAWHAYAFPMAILATIPPIHEHQWATPQLQNQQAGATGSQTQPRPVPSLYFPTLMCCNVTQSMARTAANLLGDGVQNYEASAIWYGWPSLSIHPFGGDMLWKRLT